MNPTLEHAIIAAAVLGAAGYLLSRFAIKRRSGKGCDAGCGCGSPKKAAPRR